MGLEVKMDDKDVPRIPEYYKNKTIFITGGSGFMGQALVEKLLYSCPELDSIYLLMRGKQGVPPEERLEKLYSSSCFDRLRQEKPKIFREKVHILPGDILELGLGLSQNDRTLLKNEVNIIFHVAASVRFDDTLKYAALLNIRGTRDVIELAKGMKNLSLVFHQIQKQILQPDFPIRLRATKEVTRKDLSFVHVSTCYCNSNQQVIDEVLYPPLGDWCDLLEACETLDDMTLQTLTPKYLNGMPNTYVFTKQLAEHLVSEQRGKLPVVIIRPSIVISSVEEPAPGWISNFNGPTGLCIASATGLKRSIYGTADSILNYVPVDVCIKSFIVIAWARGIAKLQDKDDVEIFNCCVSKEDTITLKDFGEKCTNSSKYTYPFSTLVWDSKIPILTNAFTLHYTIALFYSILPSFFIDSVLQLFGKEPRFMKLQRKIYIADLILNYYVSSRNWMINNENFLKVRKNLKNVDKNDFFYTTEKLYESDYIDKCVFGAKKYLLNEDINDLSQARANALRMKILDGIVKVIFIGCIIWWIVNSRSIENMYQQYSSSPHGNRWTTIEKRF